MCLLEQYSQDFIEITNWLNLRCSPYKKFHAYYINMVKNHIARGFVWCLRSIAYSIYSKLKMKIILEKMVFYRREEHGMEPVFLSKHSHTGSHLQPWKQSIRIWNNSCDISQQARCPGTLWGQRITCLCPCFRWIPCHSCSLYWNLMGRHAWGDGQLRQYHFHKDVCCRIGKACCCLLWLFLVVNLANLELTKTHAAGYTS